MYCVKNQFCQHVFISNWFAGSFWTSSAIIIAPSTLVIWCTKVKMSDKSISRIFDLKTQTINALIHNLIIRYCIFVNKCVCVCVCASLSVVYTLVYACACLSTHLTAFISLYLYLQCSKLICDVSALKYDYMRRYELVHERLNK